MIFKQRRNFLKNSFLSSVVLLTYSGELFGAVTTMETMSVVHKDLFGEVADVPTAESINANSYLYKILKHSKITSQNKAFIKDGIKWLNEEAVSKYKKTYTKLSDKQRQKVLQEIADTIWGDSWLENILTYFLEAMLGDPLYGGNKAMSGWKWLNYKPGLPRPTKAFL
ncbi:MAG: gluconate 2-dehydrogenase subunit 3 family protein [Sulfurimonas sp.]|nr:gluconate 2-dehydrogenase subunit 3 family protein [Sulfurimonas sp.]